MHGTPDDVAKRLGNVETRLQKIHDRAIGDRNDRKTWPDTLPGELEVVQKEVADIKKTVEGWRGVFNKGVSGFLIALLGTVAGVIATRVLGGG